jgi:hypothetical protein
MLSEFGRYEHRLAVVDFALSWVGRPAPDEMWVRMLGYVPEQWEPGQDRVHWCAIFAAWCLCEMLDAPWERWSSGVGIDQFLQHGLARTNRPPLPGDVAVYRHNWHHALVDCDDDPEDDLLPTIDGNAGPAPGVVAVARRPVNAALYYVSIEPLLERM